jgi:trans-2,3-dihydro-3-hydroxyanthranilate isomerase
MRLPFYTLDVFTSTQFEGAQIAVVPHADELNDKQMQKIATEFNLHSTVFVLKPLDHRNQCRLRIFSTISELTFGGHPTVAAANLLAQIGALGNDCVGKSFIFEERIGDVKVNIHAGPPDKQYAQISLSTSPVYDRFIPPIRDIAEFLDIDEASIVNEGFAPMTVTCDRPYFIVPVDSFETLCAATFKRNRWSKSIATTLAPDVLVICRSNESEASDYHGRLFGPNLSVSDDPPLGSATPALAGYLTASGEFKDGINPFVLERGAVKNRRSIINAEAFVQDGSMLNIRVGGPAVLVTEGVMHLNDAA